MSRDFRGKRADNGTWVEGYLTPMCGEYHIIDLMNENIAYPIDPETTGQDTGVTDKNKKKIFEGDIVREYFKNSWGEYDYENYDIGRVFWYGQTARFLRTSKNFVDKCPSVTNYKEYEVIGNIHDNPELLEVRDE